MAVAVAASSSIGRLGLPWPHTIMAHLPALASAHGQVVCGCGSLGRTASLVLSHPRARYIDKT